MVRSRDVEVLTASSPMATATSAVRAFQHAKVASTRTVHAREQAREGRGQTKSHCQRCTLDCRPPPSSVHGEPARRRRRHPSVPPHRHPCAKPWLPSPPAWRRPSLPQAPTHVSRGTFPAHRGCSSPRRRLARCAARAPPIARTAPRRASTWLLPLPLLLLSRRRRPGSAMAPWMRLRRR